jgi:hypothetical protein
MVKVNEFFHGLVDLYKSSQLNYVYKLEGYSPCEKDPSKFSLNVKYTAKNCYIPLTPSDIISDKNLMNGFSPSDISIITFLYVDERKHLLGVSYKIINEDIAMDMGETIFTVHKIDGGNIFRRTAREIYDDKKIFLNLKKEDIHRISFALGEHSNN